MLKLQIHSIVLWLLMFCQIYRVTDEDLIAETALSYECFFLLLKDLNFLLLFHNENMSVQNAAISKSGKK